MRRFRTVVYHEGERRVGQILPYTPGTMGQICVETICAFGPMTGIEVLYDGVSEKRAESKIKGLEDFDEFFLSMRLV